MRQAAFCELNYNHPRPCAAYRKGGEPQKLGPHHALTRPQPTFFSYFHDRSLFTFFYDLLCWPCCPLLPSQRSVAQSVLASCLRCCPRCILQQKRPYSDPRYLSEHLLTFIFSLSSSSCSMPFAASRCWRSSLCSSLTSSSWPKMLKHSMNLTQLTLLLTKKSATLSGTTDMLLLTVEAPPTDPVLAELPVSPTKLLALLEHSSSSH